MAQECVSKLERSVRSEKADGSRKRNADRLVRRDPSNCSTPVSLPAYRSEPAIEKRHLNTIKCMSLFFKRNMRQTKRTLSWFPQIVRREGEALQGETIRVRCGILNKRISEN